MCAIQIHHHTVIKTTTPRCRQGDTKDEGKSGNWCYGMICTDGQWMAWDNFNCNPTTTPKTTTPRTSKPIRTTTPRCRQGDTKDEGKSGNWCYGMICTDGQWMAWDNFNCKPTTTPKTTTPRTSKPIRTTTPRCRQGDTKDEGKSGNWCYGMICTDGQWIAWDNFNCKPTTTPKTTTPRTSKPIRTTTPRCRQGDTKDEGKSGNWCYGMICTDGQWMAWDNFNCKPTTTPKTTTPRTSKPIRTTTPRCRQGDTKDEGKSGNWCYGMICTDGQWMAWDNFNCNPTTTPKTNTPRTPIPIRTTTPGTTIPIVTTTSAGRTSTRTTTARGSSAPSTPSSAGECKLETGESVRRGARVKLGQSGHNCSGVYCSANGSLVSWEMVSCPCK